MTAYSFESDLAFGRAVQMFAAMDNWVRKPNLDGKWLIRDNDRWGDYLSWYAYDAVAPDVVKSVALFFDTHPKQVTLAVSAQRDAKPDKKDLERAWRELQSYVLDELLPSLGARNIMPSDFER